MSASVIGLDHGAFAIQATTRCSDYDRLIDAIFT
jgi:hypothetical protein